MSDPSVITTNTDPYYGCIPFDKSNTIVTPGGAPVTVDYTVRDAAGSPVDLSGYFDPSQAGTDDENGIFIRFAFADDTLVAKYVEQGNVVDAREGKIQFEIPAYVYEMPCIYSFYVAVGNKKTYILDNKPIYIGPRKGILLVEWTPFNAHVPNCSVPHRVVPSLEDVRRKLDDFVGKNDLMAQVEYSSDDIVNAMISPLRIFNETPPRLRRFHFTLTTFPYYENWVLGTAAELLRISVVHYVRNKLLSAHGGIQGDEKARDREYMQLASQYKEEYREFCRFEKHRLNFSMGQGWGTLHSEYVHLQKWRQFG